VEGVEEGGGGVGGVLNPVVQKPGNNKSCSSHTGLKTNRPGYLRLCEGGEGGGEEGRVLLAGCGTSHAPWTELDFP
jgi:hypothetical protein